MPFAWHTLAVSTPTDPRVHVPTVDDSLGTASGYIYTCNRRRLWKRSQEQLARADKSQVSLQLQPHPLRHA